MRTLLILLIFVGNAFAGISDEREVFKSGLPQTPMQMWDPFVEQDHLGTHLFFGSLFCHEDSKVTLYYSPLKCDKDSLTFAIGYGFKANGKNEFEFRSSPVFEPGILGSWDDEYVETPSVVQVEGKSYLFYSAWNKRSFKRYQIGVAVLGSSLSALLKSQIQFVRVYSDAIIAPTHQGNNFDRENTQEPSAVWNQDQKRFEVYYVGIRATKAGSTTALASSDPMDPSADIKEIGFGRKCFNLGLEKMDCEGDQTAQLTTLTGSFVNMPEVRLALGKYWLFYSDLSSASSTNDFSYGYKRTNLQTSLNGTSWSKPVTIHETKSSGLHSPTVIFNSDHYSVFAQGWWFESVDHPQECFETHFRLPHGSSQCSNTSLIELFNQR